MDKFYFVQINLIVKAYDQKHAESIGTEYLNQHPVHDPIQHAEVDLVEPINEDGEVE